MHAVSCSALKWLLHCLAVSCMLHGFGERRSVCAGYAVTKPLLMTTRHSYGMLHCILLCYIMLWSYL